MEEQRTWTEAPASATVKLISPDGYDVLFTLRGEAGADLLPKLTGALDWFKGHGYAPTTNGHARGNGHSDSSAPKCPTHNTPMKPSKHGGFYCSVKVADDDGTGRAVYCKQKA